ncbi:ATP-dependent helicase, partial [Streptomyces sp. B1866]|nr:ATP-dependent helicase [Streptomyces sp. B1866]
MTSPSAATLSPLTGLAHCSAVFLPADPARAGRIAFWRPDGPPPAGPGTVEELTVVVPRAAADGTLGSDGCPEVRTRAVRARVLPVHDALPALTRARARTAPADPAAAFWGAAVLLALHLAARGRLLPAISAAGHDTWRAGPLGSDDLRRVRELAAAMPPAAHAAPLPGAAPPLLPEPEGHLRAFLDAVVDGLVRSPAAAAAAGGPAFAAMRPVRAPELRAWAADLASGLEAGVRLSLRVELLPGEPPLATDAQAPPDGEAGPRLRAVLQLHSESDPALVADAADVWAGTGTAGAALGPRARMAALLALRRAARA